MATNSIVTVLFLACLTHSYTASKQLYDKDGLHPVRDANPSTHGDYINPPRQGEWTDWKELGQQALNKAILKTRQISRLNQNAQNAILFLGDGLGISTMTAARVYLSQSRNLTGDQAVLSWENMDYAGLSKTYSTDQLVADSANSATALVCGEKARNGVICMNQLVESQNCSSAQGNRLKSLMHMAIEAGKWTGLVTTDAIHGASPSVNYAHSPYRRWYSDADIPPGQRDCKDIASQLLDTEINHNIRVLLGGGRAYMTPDNFPDPEYPEQTGERTDGRNLIQEWKDIHLDIHPGTSAYVENRTDFMNVNGNEVDYLMGLFEPLNMQGDLNHAVEPWGEPSLAEMTEKAIQILSRSPNGFYLFVEGTLIDSAHHGTNAFGALNETAAFSDAVAKAMSMTDTADTLTVVTADHSHTFSVAGYPARNTDIFEYNDSWERTWGFQVAEDDKPYTTLLYTNGPGYYDHRTLNGSLSTWMPRKNITDEKQAGILTEPGTRQDAAVPLSSETHAGEDVAIYAQGPMSFLLQGSQEQSYIAHVIRHSLCVGENQDVCRVPPVACPSSAVTTTAVTAVTAALVTIIVLF